VHAYYVTKVTSIIRAGTARLVCVACNLFLLARFVTQVCHARRTSAHRSLVSLHWFGRLSEYSSNWRLWCSAVPLLAQLLVLSSTSFHRVADVPSRRRLRSSSTNDLIVCPTTNSYRRRSCVSGFSCQSFKQTSRQCTLDNALVLGHFTKRLAMQTQDVDYTDSCYSVVTHDFIDV